MLKRSITFLNPCFDKKYPSTSLITNILNMRKFLFSGLFLMFFSFSAVFAQNASYRSNISGQWALNGWQLISLADNIIEADTVVDAYAKASGTYGITYDRSLTKWFSLGVQGTINTGKIGARDLTVTVDEKEYTGRAELRLRRLNIGLRPMFHYFNNDRFDWYSGFRIGLNYVKTRVDIGTDQDITDSEILDALIGDNWLLNRSYRGARPTFQFVPVGFRGYITENIGLGFEAAVGPTYYFSANVNYRF
jgi:hypothetical protein